MRVDEMRRELLRAAVSRRTVTYGELMRKFNLGRGDAGRGVVAVLGEVDAAEYAAGAPGFAALVVRKDTGYPGGGYFCWDDVPVVLRRPPDRRQDPELSDSEKKYIREQQERIWSYYSAAWGQRSLA